MKEIKFPKKIHFKRLHPLISFFQQCAKNAGIKQGKYLLVPSAFSINPSDSGKLKSSIKKHYEFNKLHKFKIEYQLETDWLNHGPKESSGVKKGMVYVNENEAVKRDI